MRLFTAWFGVVLVTGQSGGGGSGGRGNFIEQKDRDLARKADLKVETACAKVDDLDITEEDRTARREDLVGASADNIILKILSESSSPDDLNVQMEEQALNPGFLLFQAGPLIAFILFLVLYVLYFCWACLPCCWCKCCRRKRKCPLLVKIIFIILVGGIVLGLVIAASLSIRGFTAAAQGFEVTQCTAAQMVNRTLGGDPDFQFLGVIRTLEIFQELQDSLEQGSAFLSDLRGILDNTRPISDAVTVCAATLTNLQSMFESASNLNPTAGGASLLHSCELCSALATPIASAVTALESGVGTALAETRGVVEEQLQGENLQQLRDSMMSGSAPLVELKTLVHAAFGPFVKEDTLETVSDQLSSVGTLSSVALIGIALVLAFCSLLTGTCWICIETSKDKEGRTSHRRTTCRCAMCSWCCGCYYMLFVLLVSGIMTAVAIPLSSLCLIMEDVDRQIINDISRPLELDLANEGGDMMIEMVEKCFVPEDPMANPLILNLIKVNNTDGSGTMTMYELIVNQTRDSIETSFNALTEQLDTGDLQLWTATSPVKQLADTLTATPSSAMMLPDSATLQASADYSDLFSSNLAPYAMSGGDCANFTVTDSSFGSLQGSVVIGIDDFGTALQSYGTLVPTPSTCASKGKVTCSPASAACTAGNNLMDLKLKLRNDAVFKCWRFVDSMGVACDAAAGVRPGAQSNRCLVMGEMRPEEYDCTLQQFTTLVQQYASTIQAVFQDLDAKTGSLQSRISEDLRDLVDEQVMGPITTVANGMTCGFLADTYQGVLDGLCYGGVWGFQAMSASYVACGVLTMLLVALTFIVWRISYDNVLMNSSDPIMRYDG